MWLYLVPPTNLPISTYYYSEWGRFVFNGDRPHPSCLQTYDDWYWYEKKKLIFCFILASVSIGLTVLECALSFFLFNFLAGYFWGFQFPNLCHVVFPSGLGGSQKKCNILIVLFLISQTIRILGGHIIWKIPILKGFMCIKNGAKKDQIWITVSWKI